jgi:hypothetical protein
MDQDPVLATLMKLKRQN